MLFQTIGIHSSGFRFPTRFQNRAAGICSHSATGTLLRSDRTDLKFYPNLQVLHRPFISFTTYSSYGEVCLQSQETRTQIQTKLLLCYINI